MLVLLYFLLKDDINLPNGRILVFATNQTLKILARAKALSADGTFKICPKLWGQVMILCAEVGLGIWVPVLFALLPDKKSQSYLAFFQSVKQCLANISESLAAKYIMIDFEIAIREMCMEVFPNVSDF